MKKNDFYAQTTILNEVLLLYTTRDIADQIIDILSGKNVELSVYDTHSDGIILRKRKDGSVEDEAIIKAFSKAIKKLIDKTSGTADDIADIINDNYDFKYSDKYMNEDFFEEILNIRRTGRLISIEIDLQ